MEVLVHDVLPVQPEAAAVTKGCVHCSMAGPGRRGRGACKKASFVLGCCVV